MGSVDLRAARGMAFDQTVFVVRQRAGLGQHAVGHGNLADIVEKSRNAQVFDIIPVFSQFFGQAAGQIGNAVGMAARVNILRVDKQAHDADDFQVIVV